MALPLLKKCCFCVPLKLGLLVWAYGKMVMPLLIIFSLMMSSLDDGIVIGLKTLSTAMPELIDLGFSVVLIVAAHKENLRMMKVYYYYSLTMLTVYALLTLLLACNREKFLILHYMIFYYPMTLDLDHNMNLIFSLMMILIQAYLMLLVRTEVHELTEGNCIDENIPREKSSASFKVNESLPPAKPATEVVNVTTDI